MGVYTVTREYAITETKLSSGDKQDKDENQARPTPASSSNDGGSATEESKTFKLLKTWVLIFTWVFLGVFAAMMGASLIDLTEIAGCSYAEIGRALTGLHVATPVGSIGGGILCGRYPGHLDLFLAVFLSTLALSSAALPWCPHLWLMSSVMAVQGLSRGALTCCGNVMLIRMWKEKSTAPLHAMHFGTGFGSFLSPMLARPFLSSQRRGLNDNIAPLQSPENGLLNRSLVTFNGTGNSTWEEATRIHISYGIEGGYGVFCAIFFFVYSLRLTRKLSTEKSKLAQCDSEKKVSSPRFKGIISPATWARGSFGFGLQMACLLFLFYCCVVGVIVSYSTYLLPVAINGNAKLAKKTATYLSSAFWGSFAAGRLVSALVAKFVPIHVMFLAELLTTLVSGAALAFVGLTSSLYLWICTCAFAFVSAPLFPSCVAWANLYMDVNGPLMSVFQSGVGAGGFVASLYGGYGLQEYGPTFPLYLNFAFAVGLVVMFTMMQILASCHGRKEKPISRVHPIELKEIGPISGSVKKTDTPA